MLKNERQNFHHSKMPNVGDIVTIPEFLTALTFSGCKAIVTNVGLCDSANYHYSYGIHLVNVELLRDRNIKYTIAGHWFFRGEQ